MTDDERAIFQEMIDRQQIHDVLVRYCRGIDRGDIDLINSAYHDDAEVAYASFTAVGKEIGPAVVNLVEKKTPRKTSMHSIMNHFVRIDVDVAFAETYFMSCGLSQSDTPEKLFENGGRYLDRFEKRNGEWKIFERRVIWDWKRTTEMAVPFNEITGGIRGTRTPDDPSYAFLEGRS